MCSAVKDTMWMELYRESGLNVVWAESLPYSKHRPNHIQRDPPWPINSQCELESHRLGFMDVLLHFLDIYPAPVHPWNHKKLLL